MQNMKTEQQKEQPQPVSAAGPAGNRIPNVIVGKELYVSGIPKIRQQALKWNGWGYRDSGFIFTDEGVFKFIGERYPLGSLMLPHFTAWVVRRLGGDFSTKISSIPEPQEFPAPIEPAPEFISTLSSNSITFSNSGPDRLFRSHGHTLHDIFSIRNGEFGRLPDFVVWPEHHDHVELIVKLAIDYNYVLIPFGGGTSVSGALRVPEEERRLVISLDTSQMNNLLKLDRSNLTATFQAGIYGQDLESILKSFGYTSGHEPDSYEFSSLGGWVATRASGMKKNTYGNIEDLLVHVRFVTPTGILEKYCQVPRISAGPDVHQFVLGSEGWFGVVTEVTLKIRPLPPIKKYGSIVFPDFESGVGCMREIARQRCQPASIRLMDNEQFHFGLSLRPPSTILSSLKESMKALYLTKFKGLNLNTICVATLLFEGTAESVAQQEAKVYEIATSSQFRGLQAGESNGLRGYTLTFVIAYIRDVALDYGIVAESFETSVPWSFTYNLCENVKLRVSRECEVLGIKHVFITCRVTQTYDVGACVYFYLAFNYKGISDPVHVFEHLETLARREILINHGSISHHHGVGKIRAKFMEHTMSGCAIDSIVALKHKLDPKNTFANGNLIMQQQHKAKL